jgi:Holliday junction resolvasome RuvABC endonuclease subunit
MNQISKPSRILAVSLSSRGFGFAVMEGNDRLIDYGNKVVRPDKNVHSLTQIEKMITRCQPDALVLHDVTAKRSHRSGRIKELHRTVVALAQRRTLTVKAIPAMEVRRRLLGDATETKHELAALLAKRFPDELASRLPPKRKLWTSEDARMDIFDAVALAAVFWMMRKRFCHPDGVVRQALTQ